MVRCFMLRISVGVLFAVNSSFIQPCQADAKECLLILYLISNHIMLYHIIYHVISYIVSYRISIISVLSYHISYHNMSYHISVVSYISHIIYRIISVLYHISCHVMSCHIISCHVISYHIPT